MEAEASEINPSGSKKLKNEYDPQQAPPLKQQLQQLVQQQVQQQQIQQVQQQQQQVHQQQ